MKYQVGDIVSMNHNALDNYGTKWEGVDLKITHKADESGGSLFDLKVAETGEPLSFSLYEWEVC